MRYAYKSMLYFRFIQASSTATQSPLLLLRREFFVITIPFLSGNGAATNHGRGRLDPQDIPPLSKETPSAQVLGGTGKITEAGPWKDLTPTSLSSPSSGIHPAHHNTLRAGKNDEVAEKPVGQQPLAGASWTKSMHSSGERGRDKNPPTSPSTATAALSFEDVSGGATSSPRSSFPSDTEGQRPAAASQNSSSIHHLFASWQQGIVASIGAVMGIGFLIFLLYAPVKEDTVHHTAVVASEVLADLRLRGRAFALSKAVVQDVLNDPKSLQLVVDLVVKLLAREETKIALSSFLQSLFEDHYTQEVTKKFVLKIIRDPWIMDHVQVIALEQVLRLLENEEVKKNLSILLTFSAEDALRNPKLQHEAARAVRKSITNAIQPWNYFKA